MQVMFCSVISLQVLLIILLHFLIPVQACPLVSLHHFPSIQGYPIFVDPVTLNPVSPPTPPSSGPLTSSSFLLHLVTLHFTPNYITSYTSLHYLLHLITLPLTLHYITYSSSPIVFPSYYLISLPCVHPVYSNRHLKVITSMWRSVRDLFLPLCLSPCRY